VLIQYSAQGLGVLEALGSWQYIATSMIKTVLKKVCKRNTLIFSFSSYLTGQFRLIVLFTLPMTVIWKPKFVADRQLWVGWGRWTYFYIADFERQLSGIISGTK
jgi:hypothetical protein